MKQLCLSLIAAMPLGPLWTVDCRADRVFVFHVQQALMIHQVQGEGYLLQGDRATIAYPSDRLDQLGAGVQTVNGKIFLRLDTQVGDLALAPHSQLRIIKIQSQPQGGKRIYLKLQPGNIQIQLPLIAPDRPMPNDPAHNWSGVRATLQNADFYSTFACRQGTTGYELATVA